MSFIHVNHKYFEAIILTQGAQLVSFKTHDSQQLLWHSSLDLFEKGKPFRGGVPICWPWFADEKIPKHGFARILEWELIEKIEQKDAVVVKFLLKENDYTLDVFPYKFKLTLAMYLSKDGFNINLNVDTSLKTTGALHTYLYVTDISQCDIIGIETTTLKIHKKIDNIYNEANTQTEIIDLNKKVMVNHTNNSDVVVWNPWKEDSKSLNDMTNNDYKNMICIETARISKKFDCQDYLSTDIRKIV